MIGKENLKIEILDNESLENLKKIVFLYTEFLFRKEKKKNALFLQV